MSALHWAVTEMSLYTAHPHHVSYKGPISFANACNLLDHRGQATWEPLFLDSRSLSWCPSHLAEVTSKNQHIFFTFCWTFVEKLTMTVPKQLCMGTKLESHCVDLGNKETEEQTKTLRLPSQENAPQRSLLHLKG